MLDQLLNKISLDCPSMVQILSDHSQFQSRLSSPFKRLIFKVLQGSGLLPILFAMHTKPVSAAIDCTSLLYNSFANDTKLLKLNITSHTYALLHYHLCLQTQMVWQCSSFCLMGLIRDIACLHMIHCYIIQVKYLIYQTTDVQVKTASQI